MITVILSPEVNELLQNYISISPDIETGGFLYGRVNPSWVYIGSISGPGPLAVQRRYCLQFDRDYILNYTQKMIDKNYFVVGTWHTHPQFSECRPSSTDIKTMQSFILHGLPYVPYVFCIANKSCPNNKVAFFSIDNTNRIEKIEDVKVGGSNAR